MSAPPQDYDYLRLNYRLNLGKGSRVRIRADASDTANRGVVGRVEGASSHVWILLDNGYRGTWHPGDVELLTAPVEEGRR